MAHLLTILGMGAVTYLTRLLPIRLFERWRIPGWAYRAMRYIPVAVLSAIIFPEVLMPGGVLDLSAGNARLFAGLLATLVAWRTHNVPATVAAGMAVLWTLQWLFPG